MFSEGRKLTGSLRLTTTEKEEEDDGKEKEEEEETSYEHLECKLRTDHGALSSFTEHQEL
jgi:hypothetical protein